MYTDVSKEIECVIFVIILKYCFEEWLSANIHDLNTNLKFFLPKFWNSILYFFFFFFQYSTVL
jgi:hypothetical protein